MAKETELHDQAERDLLEDGWTLVEEVQTKGRAGRYSVDLLGFADFLCLRTGGPIHLVQVTDGNHSAARRNKILGSARALAWILAGGTVELIWYSPLGRRRTRQRIEHRPGGLVALEPAVIESAGPG